MDAGDPDLDGESSQGADRVFVLRFWLEGDRAGPAAHWRGKVTEVHSRRTTLVNGVEQALATVRARMAQGQSG